MTTEEKIALIAELAAINGRQREHMDYHANLVRYNQRKIIKMSMELSLPIEDSLGVTLRNRDITEDALLSKVAEAYSKRAQLDDPEFKGDRHDLLLEIKNTDREVLELMAERGFLDVSIKAQLKQETR